jgi:hypothetical protein
MIYSCIIHSSKIISEYSDEMGDFSSMIKKILNANKQPIEFYVVPYLNYDFYFYNQDQYTFGAITHSSQDNEKVLLFLQEINQEFKKLKNSKEINSFSFKCAKMIREKMIQYREKYSENKYDKLNNKLNSIIEEKRNQLEESLEKDALINRINEKSNDLKNNSIDLKMKTRNKFSKQRRNRYLIIIGFIVIIFVLGYYFHHLYKSIDKKNNTKFLNNK